MGSKPRHSPIEKRKADHIAIAGSGAADFDRQTTLLEQVHLVHQSLPERAADDIDMSTTLFGKSLAAPIVISGMTGGTERAAAINRDLSRAAERAGIAFGVGSQRAMAEKPELTSTYQVRDVAPDVVLIGNIGAVQAKDYGTARVAELGKRIEVDAMAVHLNPAQEMIQRRGDRDFSNVLATIARLVETLDVPVIAKETGCGLSPRAARALASVGVKTVDVSGAGGTSWVAVEAVRAQKDSAEKRMGHSLWDWGIPTAATTAACAAAGLEVIATGGLRDGYDVARAIAMGARCGGLAAGALRAQQAGGESGAVAFIEELAHTVRTVTLLTGCSSAAELSSAPRHLGADLRDWLVSLGVR